MREKPKRPTADDFLHDDEFDAFARWEKYADDIDAWLKERGTEMMERILEGKPDANKLAHIYYLDHPQTKSRREA